MSSKICMMTLTKMFFNDKYPDAELVRINAISSTDTNVTVLYLRDGKKLRTSICKADMVLWLVQQ